MIKWTSDIPIGRDGQFLIIDNPPIADDFFANIALKEATHVAVIAQSVERGACNSKAVGSNPAGGFKGVEFGTVKLRCRVLDNPLAP